MKREKGSEFYNDWPLLPDVTVPDHVESRTGILGPDGKEIVRQPRPIGFGRWT